MPAEHGGWGLTLEPGILGVLVAPSVAGLLLGAAALLAFLVRTPLRLVLIGRYRSGDRSRSAVSLERMRLATLIAGLELIGIGIGIVATALLASDPMWWLPMAVACPQGPAWSWGSWGELSRHLVPEIVGSIAIAGVAAMGALAGGATWPLAIGAWVILGARILSSIPHVRAQVLRLHRQEVPAALTLVGDLAALGTAIVAVLLEPTLILGALAIVGLIVVQRITLVRPPRPAKILGVRQMILGFTVVGATAAGVWLL